MTNRDKIKAMILDLLEWVDYDLAKQYSRDTAENPEVVDDAMDDLVEIVEKHFPELKG